MMDANALGTGENVAWIYAKGGTTPIAPIENASSLEWGRALNDVSTATVKVSTGAHGDCCSIYGRLGTWGHELVVFRDGKRVWEGPITSIKWRRGSVEIIARDVLAWTLREPIRDIVDSVPMPVVEAGVWDIFQTFNTSGHDPNVLAYFQAFDQAASPPVSRDVLPHSGYVYGQLTEMVNSGLMFTTVGRSILMWHSAHVLGRTGTLDPMRHTSGDVEVEEDGMQVAPRVVFTTDDGETAEAGPAIDPFYGRLTTLVSSEGLGALDEMAATYREQNYPAPLTVTIPSGSVLDCAAPFPMETLVAGTVMPVRIEGGICREVNATQILTGVKVTADAGEKVAIDLAPVSTGAVEGEPA